MRVSFLGLWLPWPFCPNQDGTAGGPMQPPFKETASLRGPPCFGYTVVVRGVEPRAALFGTGAGDQGACLAWRFAFVAYFS